MAADTNSFQQETDSFKFIDAEFEAINILSSNIINNNTVWFSQPPSVVRSLVGTRFASWNNYECLILALINASNFAALTEPIKTAIISDIVTARASKPTQCEIRRLLNCYLAYPRHSIRPDTQCCEQCATLSRSEIIGYKSLYARVEQIMRTEYPNDSSLPRLPSPIHNTETV